MTPILTRFATAAIAALAAFACMSPDMAKAADPTGIWLTEDGRARVRTEHCGSDGRHLCGYVVWLQKPEGEDGKPRTDRYHPDARRQARTILRFSSQAAGAASRSPFRPAARRLRSGGKAA